MYSYGSPHTAAQKQDDQHERTFSSYVRIQVVVLKTYLGRWTIGRSGERGSGISVLPARYMICITMDLALNHWQKLICHKKKNNQPTNQSSLISMDCEMRGKWVYGYCFVRMLLPARRTFVHKKKKKIQRLSVVPI